MERIVYFHDIECLYNFFCVCIKKHNSDERFVFEISSRKNELSELYSFYTNQKNNFFVSFNGIKYDDVLITYIIENYKSLKKENNVLELTKKLRLRSNQIIGNDDEIQLKSKYYTQLDVQRYWSLKVRKDKQISLKSSAVLLNHHLIQELPYHEYVPEDKIDDMIFYCHNDVDVTEKIFFKLIDSYKLRFSLQKEYGNVFNKDDVNLGVHILLTKYKRENNVEEFEKGKDTLATTFGKDIIDEKIKFKTKEFNNVLEHFRNSTLTSIKGEVVIPKYKFAFQYGVGGIHTNNITEIVRPKDNELFLTDDVESLYPTILINRNVYPPQLGESFVRLFDSMKKDRVEAKKIYKTLNKKKDLTDEERVIKNNAQLLNESYKLALNGSIGMLKMEYSPLFYPVGNRVITINGQLYLLMIAEQCLLEGFKVDELNTDGINVILPENKLQTYIDIIDYYSKLLNLNFERERYLYLVRNGVNSYFAKKDNGEFKRKGIYVIPDFKSYHSNNSLVIPNSIIEFYDKGINPKDYICNQTNIFDFCMSQKVDRKFDVFWNNEKQQRLNRYYASKKGAYLYKKEKNNLKAKPQHLLKDAGVMLYNNHIEQEFMRYNVDFQYYINQANKMIADISYREPVLF